MLHVKSIISRTTLTCTLQNLSLHGVLLNKPKEKERIHTLLLHTKINTYYVHVLLNLVAPW